MPLRAHYLQHVPFESPGSVLAWLTAQQASVRATRLFDAEPLPRADDFDLLVVMGGSMSVNDEALFPWIKAEKQLIREVVDSGRAVLGICLGAQLIASALGSRVFSNAVKEIGWFPVEAVPQNSDAFRLPAMMPVFHWHGETFDMPPGAVRLASSVGCANQAFQIGARVIGFQFHLEVTAADVRAMVAEGRDELTPDRFVQTEETLLAVSDETYVPGNRLMDDALDFLTRAL